MSSPPISPSQESEAIPEYRAFCHWLGQQFAGGEPDRDEDGVATL
ncbi:hypothetical protein [Aeromonas enteropelogenes]